jgi:uridylate kinase
MEPAVSRTIYHTLTDEEVEALRKIAKRFAESQGHGETIASVFGGGNLVVSQTGGAYHLAVVVGGTDEPEAP